MIQKCNRDVRNISEADSDSDHYKVRGKMKIKRTLKTPSNILCGTNQT